MAGQVAVVTGANQGGIGYAIVKELCERGIQFVYYTDRDEIKGTAAVNHLKNQGFNPVFYQLEVTDVIGIETFARYIKIKHGGIDVLINNAAIFVSKSYKATEEEINTINEINNYNNLHIQEYLFPILKSKARVVFVASNGFNVPLINSAQGVVPATDKDDLKMNDVVNFGDWLCSGQTLALKKEDSKSWKKL